MNLQRWLEKKGFQLELKSIEAVVSLASDGATVPFIARYRKEQTGNLDEVAIRGILETNEEFSEFVKRKAFVLEQVQKAGKLDAATKTLIESCDEALILEDIYAPFKPKKKSKATVARDAGLEPLALWVWDTAQGVTKWEEGQSLLVWAYTYRNEKFGIESAEKAIEGARDILIEKISEDVELRQFVRDHFFNHGFLRSEKGKKAAPHSKFEPYFNFSESIKSLNNFQSSHRYLAVRRGWGDDELAVKFGAKISTEDDAFYSSMFNKYLGKCLVKAEAPGASLIKECCEMALKAHVIPSIENEVHKELKRIADEAAINVFSENVREILLSSPFGSKSVMGVDPGLRTGCKVAIVDETGRFLDNTVIHIHSTSEQEKATRLLESFVERYNVRAVAVGNGTGGRETETFLRKALKRFAKLQVVMVSEAGASVYSASEVAREEFPSLDVTVRGAISIARRLQDPLAELIKIDPKSIGVGQYQHDVNQSRLKRNLDDVVDSCVNSVGVNLNTASHHLLAHVAGIGPSLAKTIVDHRASKGIFKSRLELKDVARFSEKVFEQAAGFLRVFESDNPLEKTGVHPERYESLQSFASKNGLALSDLCGEGTKKLRASEEFKNQVGEFTFEDILRELEKPGRDPRDEFVPFQYREDIHAVSDLKKDMVCPGIVTNVTNFGAFVDIGVHQDGLVHLSQLADRFVKDPREVVSPGDRVTVKVLDVDTNKNQISLTMRSLRPDHKKPEYFDHKRTEQRAPDSRQSERRPDNRGGDRSRRDFAKDRPAKPKFANNPFEILSAIKKDIKR
jgi:uncharacterized protein